MFYEYALEPRLVASWCVSACFKFCLRQFGLKSQRIISRYPDHWLTLVEEAVTDKNSFIEKSKKTEIEKQVMGRMVKRDSGCYPYEPLLPWYDNVKCVNDKKSFHKIVSTINPNHIENIKIVSEASDLLTLEEHDSHRRVEREPEKIAEAMKPLLRAANHIAFVDPYFDLGKYQFKAVFQECANIIGGRPDLNSIKIEIHTSNERYFHFVSEVRLSCLKRTNEVRTDALDKEKALEIATSIINQIKNIPRLVNIQLRIVVWKERHKGSQLHNRYILTEIGGVMFGHGLDKQISVRNGYDDVVCLNSEGEYSTRWNDYIGDNPSFDVVFDKTFCPEGATE